jgi:hypothetical protein
MDEKEIRLAMERLKRIEAEARRRLLEEKQKKTKPSNPSIVSKIDKPKLFCKVITPSGKQCSRYQVEGCAEKCKQHHEVKLKPVPMKIEKEVKPKNPEVKPVPMKIEKEVKPKKKESIPAAIKTLVWNKWIGEKVAEAGCYACRVTTISMRHHHCGHVVSEKNGGKCTIDNLRPVCANCNLSMNTMNMKEYIEKFGLHK